MNEREFLTAMLFLPGLVIIGGVVVMVWGIRHATRQAELQHAERMAMIERGMTPPEPPRHDRQRRAHGFKMSLGILLCGLGMGLLMLITFAAGAFGTGLGIGGAITMVGLAFIVSAMFTERQAEAPRAAAEAMVKRRSFEPPMPPPPEPPPAP
ncbi:MAG: DUF6249 domain-containing protein [Vicinamibacterales bacterium]